MSLFEMRRRAISHLVLEKKCQVKCVADRLKISRKTVYNHMDDLKINTHKDDRHNCDQDQMAEALVRYFYFGLEVEKPAIAKLMKMTTQNVYEILHKIGRQ